MAVMHLVQPAVAADALHCGIADRLFSIVPSNGHDAAQHAARFAAVRPPVSGRASGRLVDLRTQYSDPA